ncbi:MAG: hypothetical protein JNL05_08360 [Flavobacteriales bacterium]|nr:hypothetical protein [Flavobacteriales bacterium]
MDATEQFAHLRKLLDEALLLVSELEAEQLVGSHTVLAKPDAHVRSQLLTPTGKIRGLSDRIIGALREKQEPMTASELTTAVYDRQYGLSYDAMKRRVAVCTSALHKRQGKLVWQKMESGEVYWYLPEWVEQGKQAWKGSLITDRLLVVHDMLKSTHPRLQTPTENTETNPSPNDDESSLS